MKSLGVLSTEAESRHQFFQEPDNFLSSSLLSSQWFFTFTPQGPHGDPHETPGSHLPGSSPFLTANALAFVIIQIYFPKGLLKNQSGPFQQSVLGL